jgi:hypothetical protein
MQPGRMRVGEADAAGAPLLRALRSGGRRLWVEPELAGAALALGLLEPGGMERQLARGGGPRGRSETSLLALPGRGERLHLRGLRPGGLLAPLRGEGRLRLARPLAELRVGAALAAAGAPVARPVLLVARRCGARWRAARGTLYEESTQDVVSFLASRPGPERLRRGVGAAARALRQLHAAGGSHPDLHAGNLLLREARGGCEAIVVDLDGVRLGPPPRPRQRMTQLMRLYRSLAKRGLLENVGVAGCAHFLRIYTGGDRGLRAALLAELPRQRLRLRLHALAWARRPTESAS